MTDLDQLFREATDHVASPDLAGRALAAAHRRRVRRTAVAALAAVVLLGGGVAWAVQDPTPKAGVVDTPVPEPELKDRLDALMDLPTAPSIDSSAVQPVWDPDTVDALPSAELGLPSSLMPPSGGAAALTGIPRARAAVMLEDSVHVLAEDGSWHVTKLPEERMRFHEYNLALSRDGTIVSVTGATGLLSLDVSRARWWRTPYPEGSGVEDGGGSDLRAGVGDTTWVAGRRDWYEVDVQTGVGAPLRLPRYVGLVAFAPDGGVVGLGSVRGPYFVRTITEVGPEGGAPEVTSVSGLQNLTEPATDGESLAAVRGLLMVSTGSGAPRDRDGLIALDLADMSTRAYLPLEDPHTYYSRGFMGPEAWLDADTVLVWVIDPEGSYVNGERTLFTWNVETGVLRRATSLRADLPYDVALDLLVE